MVLLALTLLAASSSRGGDQPLVELSLRLDGDVAAVRATIARRSLWFDLDTGATHTIVDAAAAKKLGLKGLSTQQIHGAGAGTVSALRLAPFPVQLQSQRFYPGDPLAVDLSHVGSALVQGGILGFDFYRRYVVAVNFDTRRVALYEPGTYAHAGGGAAIPLVLRPPRAYVNVLVAAPGVSPERHLLRLDTGSSDAVDDDIVLRSSAPKTPISGGVGIGSRFKSYLGTVSSLTIGPFVLRDLPSATGGVQLIGNGVWRRFNVVFDFSRSKMYLTPRTGRPVDR